MNNPSILITIDKKFVALKYIESITASDDLDNLNNVLKNDIILEVSMISGKEYEIKLSEQYHVLGKFEKTNYENLELAKNCIVNCWINMLKEQ